jgi:hypothetical protein
VRLKKRNAPAAIEAKVKKVPARGTQASLRSEDVTELPKSGAILLQGADW